MTDPVSYYVRMQRPLFIAKQSAAPSGVLGRIIATIMSHETERLNARAVELLDVAATSSVLEVGFGHGRTLGLLLAAADHGRVSGLDVSPDMARMAARRNAYAVAAGRLDLRTGDAATMPFEAASFDRALCVHTLYFWSDASRCLREVRRVLRPTARLVLAFTPATSLRAAAFPGDVYRFYQDDEVVELLRGAGFATVDLTHLGDATLASARV
jgi:ubiquinone/menaquinone biosynthesis C-methylase UbiE